MAPEAFGHFILHSAGFRLTRGPKNPILLMETRPRGGLRVAPKALSPFSCAARTPPDPNKENPPTPQKLSLPVALPLILEARQPGQKLPTEPPPEPARP